MGCTNTKELTAARICEGLKAALDLATKKTIEQLGAAGGFANSPTLRIKIPVEFVKNFENVPGVGTQIREFEDKLNEAAEAAAGSCYAIFRSAVDQLNFEDARAILDGGNDAATKIFRQVLGTQLLEQFKPIVKDKLNEVGAVKAFTTIANALDSAAGAAGEAFSALKGFVSGEKETKTDNGKKFSDFDIYDHVVNNTFEAFFGRLAFWENEVRNSPEMQKTTAVLGEVFGSKQQRK